MNGVAVLDLWVMGEPWVMPELVSARVARSVASPASDWLATHGVRIAAFVVGGAVAGFLVRRLIRQVVRHARRSTHSGTPRSGVPHSGPPQSDPRVEARVATVGSALRGLTTTIVLVIVLLLVLGELDINLGPLLAGAGVAGVALGFGAQSLVRDFLAGVFILLEDQYGVGDYVDLGVATGKVEELTLRATRLRDERGTVWHVPNGEVRRAGNLSQQFSRAVLDIVVAHGTDLAMARGALEDASTRLWEPDRAEGRLIAPPEVLGVQSLDPKGITLRVVADTVPGAQWSVERELRLATSEALAGAGVLLASTLPGAVSPDLGGDGSDPSAGR